jgi:P27 family predicted phage terminase small subunit
MPGRPWLRRQPNAWAATQTNKDQSFDWESWKATAQSPRAAASACVTRLSAAAKPGRRGEWTRLTAELAKLNLITHLDRGVLATYCVAYALWVEAIEQVQRIGTVVKSPTGYPIQSPFLAIANRQAEIMLRVASEFGFTPASRSRISAPPPDQLPLLDLTLDDYEEDSDGMRY